MEKTYSNQVIRIEQTKEDVVSIKWQGECPAIAIQIHLFYLDLISEIEQALWQIPYDYDCYISTDTEEKKQTIKQMLSLGKACKKLEITVYPNRGRDVAPFLMQMKEKAGQYKYICHLHTKKSETVDFGDQWRRFLYHHLVGSRAYVAELFRLFEEDPSLGVIIPPIYPIIERGAQWSGTKEKIKELIEKWGKTPRLPKRPVFPAGTMFWAKTEAVKDVFEEDFGWEDFPDEAGQVNETLAHVIERIWVYAAQNRGYGHKICFNDVQIPMEKEKKRLLLYVHYNQGKEVSKEDLASITDLRKTMDEIVFVTNSKVSGESKKEIERLTDVQIYRKNEGYDFGAWKAAIKKLGKEYLLGFEQLVLMNNSVIGPIYELEPIFSKMEKENSDVWGITLYPYCEDGSFVQEPCIPEHLQSYFLVFNKKVVESATFLDYWNQYEPSNELAKTIARGEIKLTPYFKEAGFQCGAYLPESRDLVQWFQTGQPHNELCYQYAILGAPFLKKKARDFLSDENRKKLLEYMEQLPVPDCYRAFYKATSPVMIKKDCIIKRGYRLLRREGIRGVLRKLKKAPPAAEKGKLIQYYSFATNQKEIPFEPNEYAIHKEDEKKILNWIIPDMGEGSGGHINMFRFISRLEENGFHNRLYLFQSLLYKNDEEIRSFLREKFPILDKRVEVYQDVSSMKFAHGTIATFWQTAYYLKRFQNTVSKFYFIQDFEPAFYAHGSDYELAKKTYTFGFRGITAGEWLKDLVEKEYGMRADSFHFSYDRDTYQRKEKKDKKKRVFFYARPVTPRRDFELGLFALQELCNRCKDVEVVFAGWDLDNYVIPFRHKNLGILPVSKLSEVYANCDLCLVLSHTNLSLLPLEVMASGSVPVCSKGENSTWLVNEENAILVENQIEDIADTLEYYLCHPEELDKIREKGYEFALSTSWDQEAEKVRKIILEGIKEDERS